jgi:hypothetical protein
MYHNTDKHIQNANSVSSKLVKAGVQYSSPVRSVSVSGIARLFTGVESRLRRMQKPVRIDGQRTSAVSLY